MSFQVTDILSLIHNPDWPPDRWRTVSPFTRLRQMGIDARWAWGDDDQMLETDPSSTILVIPRQSGSDEHAIDAWLDERRPKVRAIVYECDDVLFDDDMLEHLQLAEFTQGRLPHEIRHEAKMARYFASRCDGVTVSSEPLAEVVRAFTDKPVICVPNAIDVRDFRARLAYRPGWSEHLTIGWSGGRRPERDILPMAEAWGRVSKRYPEVRFVVAAPVCPDAIYRFVEDDSRIIRLPWLSWHDYPMSMQVNIGCASVADTRFSRCKTYIKALEFGLGGAAVCATPTLYGQVIDDGETGLLATTADEWEAALVRLIDDAELRRRLSVAWVSKIERCYSLDENLWRWPSAYSEIVDSMAGAGEVAA